MTALSNRALLVTLNISQWTARKLDRAESAAVNAKHGTVVDAARVNKSLLPMSDKLDKVHKLTGSVRTEYYHFSLPWMDGMQVIKSEAYLDFAKRMSERKREWQMAVDAFISSYADAVDDARHLLGTLFNEADYPPVSELRAKFRFDVGFYPVPDASDWRLDVADDEMARLRADITEQVQAKQGEAMRAAWDRISEVVKRIHTQTSNPKGKIYDSLVDNARDLCSILPSLNIADDPKMEEIRLELEYSLSGTAAADLRNYPEVREEMSDRMADIMDKMGGLYGA